MMTLNKLVSVMGLSLILTAPTFAATNLVQQAKTENRTEQTHNVKREADFKKTEQETESRKSRAGCQT